MRQFGVSRRSVLGAGVVGIGATTIVACGNDTETGTSAPSDAGGDQAPAPPPLGIDEFRESLPDQGAHLTDAEFIDLSGPIGAAVTLVRSPSARGLSEAVDIAANKVLREQNMRGDRPAEVTLTSTVVIAGESCLGVLQETEDAEGSAVQMVYYSAELDLACTSPALIEPSQWGALADALEAAVEDDRDVAAMREFLREQPRPWGNGPTLAPTAEGEVFAFFPAMPTDQQVVKIPAEQAADLLSDFGREILAAAAAPADFLAERIAVPEPDSADGDGAYIVPDDVWQAQRARTSEGPGPRTQLAPLADPGVRPNPVAAPDATRVKSVALTFDDGPDSSLNSRLRQRLRMHGAAATFFMIGRSAKTWPGAISATALDGYELANHSWSHPQLSRVSEEKLNDELRKTNEAIAEAAGRAPYLLRPPYGARNETVDRVAGEHQLSVQLWDVDSMDWANKDVEKNLRDIQAEVGRGSIVLMHEIHQPTIDTMEPLLEWLDEQDFTVFTCAEIGQNQMYAGKHYRAGLVRIDEQHPAPPPSDGGGEATEPADGGEASESAEGGEG